MTDFERRYHQYVENFALDIGAAVMLEKGGYNISIPGIVLRILYKTKNGVLKGLSILLKLGSEF